MQIKLTSLMVDDQDKALAFYTDRLGFEKKHDIPMGPFRWLTVTSPEGADGVELVLEPMGFAPARDFQRALFEAGIPATAFISTDIAAEFACLTAKGVRFRGEPQAMGPVTAQCCSKTAAAT
jgi:catechol 2,3-dioxygenase-like lactoylglutathione lyase family enzyme